MVKLNKMFSSISYSDQNECSEGITVTSQFAQATAVVVLRIIAKSAMHNGTCYLGIDESTGRIFRPIKNTEPGLCCWPSYTNMCLGLSYRFGVILNPDNTTAFVTQFPHCNEDMVVNSTVQESTMPFNKQVLMNPRIAQPDISCIFKAIKECKYLIENEHSRSAGILRCSSSMVSMYTIKRENKKDQLRCCIQLASGLYDLSVTGLHDVLPQDNRDIIVVLGLARPFSNCGAFQPPRCYILVVGLFVL